MRQADVDWVRYRQSAQQTPWLNAEDERQLLCRARAGDKCAVNALVESHMRLVVQIAARYARDGLAAHDLVSEGVLGLLEAVRRFDLTQRTRFAAYAGWWVRASVREYALANRRMVGAPASRAARVARGKLRQAEVLLVQRLGRTPTCAETAEVLGVSERDVELVEVSLSSRDVSLTLPDRSDETEIPDEALGPEQALVQAQQQAYVERSVADALEALSERERMVVCGQFLREEGESLSDLGLSLGVSRQRAGQIWASARGKLRTRLRAVA